MACKPSSINFIKILYLYIPRRGEVVVVEPGRPLKAMPLNLIEKNSASIYLLLTSMYWAECPAGQL